MAEALDAKPVTAHLEKSVKAPVVPRPPQIDKLGSSIDTARAQQSTLPREVQLAARKPGVRGQPFKML